MLQLEKFPLKRRSFLNLSLFSKKQKSKKAKKKEQKNEKAEAEHGEI
jgi:hypothetical protein